MTVGVLVCDYSDENAETFRATCDKSDALILLKWLLSEKDLHNQQSTRLLVFRFSGQIAVNFPDLILNCDPRNQMPQATPEGLGDSLLKQAMQLWIEPEVARRTSAGTLPAKIELAQVVLPPLGLPLVRFNEEVKVLLEGRFKAGAAPLKVGDQAPLAEVDEILGATLTETDADCAHITIVFGEIVHHIAFDFRYNAGRIKILIDRAEEFLASARAAHRREASAAFVENLFAATELLAKGRLLLTPNNPAFFREKGSHKLIKSEFNRQGKGGAVPDDTVKLLNQLSDLRYRARYGDERFAVGTDRRRSMLTQCTKLRAYVAKMRPKNDLKA